MKNKGKYSVKYEGLYKHNHGLIIKMPPFLMNNRPKVPYEQLKKEQKFK